MRDSIGRISLTGSRRQDFALADSAAKWPNGVRPEGYTWHHHHDVGRMVLVPTEVHRSFAHTGGFALWERIKGKVYQE